MTETSDEGADLPQGNSTWMTERKAVFRDGGVSANKLAQANKKRGIEVETVRNLPGGLGTEVIVRKPVMSIPREVTKPLWKKLFGVD